MRVDKNRDSYSGSAAVEQYSKATEVAACESYLFDKYATGNKAILDLGVGGGRTTAYLSALAGCYVGLDYSNVLVEACQRKFPSLKFVCEDATNLQRFMADTFDVVVFSFNGIDSILTDRDRASCFREVARVLRPGGYFIFSSHNARSIGLTANIRKYLTDRRAIKPKAVGAKIQPNVATTSVFDRLRSLAAEMGPGRLFRKFLRSIRISAGLFLRKLYVRKMYKGTGYYPDQSHGGLTLFVSTPEYILAESKAAGFEVLEMISNTYPMSVPDYAIQWYYYTLRVGRKQ